MPDPDDLMSGNEGSWKCNVYGEPFDYQTKLEWNCTSILYGIP